MPESYSWEIREQAEELYIIDGLTYEQAAERTGVSLSQLKRWGADSDWSGRRKEYRQAQTSIRRGVMLAKAKAINAVIESMDPQTAYAFSSLVSSGKIIEEEAREARATAPAPALGSIERPIRTAADAVAALREAVERRVNAMLAQPGAVSLAGIKEMRQALEMLEKLSAQVAQGEVGADDEAARLTPERLKEIVREGYGV